MSYLPLFLKVNEKQSVLVIGGGEIAAAKTEALASVGAHVEIIAQELHEGVLDLADRYGFPVREASYDVSQIEGKALIIAATDDDDLNQEIAFDCRRRGILVNVVDNPPLCDFIFPALVRRGPLQIAISSSGIAPVMARMIKQTLEQIVPSEFEKLVHFMAHKKQNLRAKLKSLQPRRLFSEQVIRGSIAEEVLEGNLSKADDKFAEALAAYPNKCQPALYLIGAGPGNPDLITLKAIRLLGRADVVLYDRLVSPVLIEQYARKDAQKIYVGKTRCYHHKTQQDIDGLIRDHLKQGDIVVRLKGGDPAIFAHGAEEIAIANELGVPYQIVPGITAASGCAAYSGIPLTERDGAYSVRFLTLYKNSLSDARFWASLSYAHNETLVFYMSSQNYSLLCNNLIEKSGFSANTPFLVVEQGTTPYQKELPGMLGQFDEQYGDYKFASPCLMVIGDVVKWQENHSWKEQSREDGLYFPSLPLKATLEQETAA